MTIFEKLVVGTQHVLEMPQAFVSEEGIDAINNYLSQTYPERYRELRNNLGEYELWLNRDWPRDIIVGKGTYTGSFAKRVANWLFKERGIKATSEVISQIGNLASRHSAKHGQYVFDFTRQINWRRGDFGDEESCYWGEHAAAKNMLMDNGSLAIRFYDPGNLRRGIGRAWIAPLHPEAMVLNDQDLRVPLDRAEALILFNGYGIETVKIARLLAMFLGVSYKPVTLENNGRSDGMLWLNHYRDGIYAGGRGFILGLPDAILPVTYVDLQFDEYDEDSEPEYDYTCDGCGTGLYSDDTYRPDDGDGVYCESCYSDRYTRCERCGHEMSTDDTTEVMVRNRNTWGLRTYTESWCEHCRSAHASQCDECENCFQDELIIFGPDDRPYCERCHGDRFTTCDHCGETVDRDTACGCRDEETPTADVGESVDIPF